MSVDTLRRAVGGRSSVPVGGLLGAQCPQCTAKSGRWLFAGASNARHPLVTVRGDEGSKVRHWSRYPRPLLIGLSSALR